MVNIYHSHRKAFKECYYWNINEEIRNTTEYALNHKADGFFLAEAYDEATRTNSKQFGGVIFKPDNETFTIYTVDEIDLKPASLVQYNGKIWNVVSISQVIDDREIEYDDGIEGTIIQLRR